MKLLRRAFLLSLALAGLANGGLYAARHLFQTSGGEILYEGWHGENWDLYLLDLATGIAHNLTRSGADERDPAWSPDGQQIAFSADRDGDSQPELYLMNANGGSLRRISSGSGGYRSPEWSADGETLAFVLGFGQMYVMHLPSGEQRWLGVGFTPVLAPDGQTVLYSAETNTFINSDIFAGDMNSPRVTNLTDTSSTEWGARWSPDGRQIVFASLRGGTVNIYAMNADGNNTRTIVQAGVNALSPAWSPDGSQIVFTAALDGTTQLFVVGADGGSPRAITASAGDKQSPVWRPVIR